MKDLRKNLKFAWQYANNVKSKIIMFIVFDFAQIIISIILPIISAKMIVKLNTKKLEQVIYLKINIFLIQTKKNII